MTPDIQKKGEAALRAAAAREGGPEGANRMFATGGRSLHGSSRENGVLAVFPLRVLLAQNIAQLLCGGIRARLSARRADARKSPMIKQPLVELYRAARKAAENAYAPYSSFPVGAALLMPDGSVITGANVENRSFGLTNCAERTAVFTACAVGFRTFSAAAIAAPKAAYPVGPCGACRQVLSEFAPPETPVVFGADEAHLVETTIGALYPCDSLHELAE
jgi:cytidine deaminase